MNTKKLFVPVLIGLFLASLLMFWDSPSVEATTFEKTRVVYSDTDDGDIVCGNSSYPVAHNKSWGDVVDSIPTFAVGQEFVAQYQVLRTFLFFDTSMIADGANVTDAKLSLYVNTDYSYTEFNITIQNGQPTYPHKPLQTGDYYYSHYTGEGGTLNTSSLSAGYNNITLTTQGLSWINLEGITKFCLRSSRDINSDVPTGKEWVGFKAREAGEAYAPKLYITYEYEGKSYILHGAYNEQSYRDGAINVTLYKATESPETFELDGTETKDVEAVPTAFHFDIGYNESRVYYLKDDFEEIYVFKPSSPYYTYYFTVIDYVGITNGYLETIINVNGTDRVVERWTLDVLNDIPFTLSWGGVYKVKLICDQGTYVFGSVAAEATTSFTFPVTRAAFPPDATHIGNITVSAGRPVANELQLNYTDVGNDTDWVYVAIYELTGSTVIWSTNNTGSTHQISWTNADNKTDYRVKAQANHQAIGGLSWTFSLSAPYVQYNPWDFSVLGTFPFESTQLIGFFVVLAVFACFSVANAGVGMIVGVIITAFLVYMGWLDIGWAWLATVLAIAILALISIHRKGGVRAI